MNFLSFLFSYQSTAFSSQTVDGHQTYFGGSVVGNAPTIGIEISPTPPLIFTGGQKVRNLASFKHHSTLTRLRLKMQQGIQTLKQTSCLGMITVCPRQVW